MSTADWPTWSTQLFRGNVACANWSNCGNGEVRIAQGGGIALAEGSLDAINTTISANLACSNVTDCPGTGAGGGIDDGGDVTLSNTIVAGNGTSDGSGDCGPSFGSPFFQDGAPTNGAITIGHNVVGPSCALPNSPDQDTVTTTPLLAALASNGGSGQTMALLAGSPALNHGESRTCLAGSVVDVFGGTVAGPSDFDERGVAAWREPAAYAIPAPGMRVRHFPWSARAAIMPAA